jgi:APA family basic amino acid/polyamine antiporter
MAQETKRPQRNLPVGILGSLIICTVLFMLFGYVMTGLAHYTAFQGSAAPVAVAIAKMPYNWLGILIIGAILVGYTSVILVDLLGQSRVFYSMSRDGLLSGIFSQIHARFSTPYKSSVVLCVFISLFAGLVPISVVGEMTSIGTLLAFVMVCLAVIILRKKQPDAPRAFRVPLVPLIPVLGIATCLLMMVSLPAATWLRLAGWLAVGFAIYFGYGKRNSRLNDELKTAQQGEFTRCRLENDVPAHSESHHAPQQ